MWSSHVMFLFAGDHDWRFKRHCPLDNLRVWRANTLIIQLGQRGVGTLSPQQSKAGE
ncbi:MAG: hypothetical protein F6K58_13795 [Symploca sp. SIO2E9]|nr:hypothetical protein [Symploca sp. SIO2E9]